MCVEIYIGLKPSERDLTISDSESGFWSRPLPPGPKRVRAFMELETIYEVGSFLGCTCGLSYGDWSRQDVDEEHDKRIENVIAFGELLHQHQESVVRLLTLEDYRIPSLDQFPKHRLNVQSMMANVNEFSLESDCVYELQS